MFITDLRKKSHEIRSINYGYDMYRVYYVCMVMICINFGYDMYRVYGYNMFSAHLNLVRTQVEIISDPNYLVRTFFERLFSRHLI